MFFGVMFVQIICFYGNVMQGMMGMYLEKNIQVFVDIQSKLVENLKDLYSGNFFNFDMWLQFMNMQGLMM